jgi:hypothetical protein
MSIKCRESLQESLQARFKLIAKLDGLNLLVDKSQIPVHREFDEYRQDVRFIYSPQAEDYSLNADLWYLNLVYKCSFYQELQKEYTKRWAHLQAQRLGFSVHEVPGDDGTIKFVFASPTGQVEAQLNREGKLQLEVNGVLGEGCLQFSQALESAAGSIEERVRTPDFYREQQAYYANQQQIGGW